MFKVFSIFLLAGSLSACTPLIPFNADNTASPDGPKHYHFDWQLTGHRAVAPLQVFDDGERTWLQFVTGQPVPAIFAVLPEGDRLLRPQTVGAYQVIDGVWPQLRVRGGRQQTLIRRLSAVGNATSSNAQISSAQISPVQISRTVPERMIQTKREPLSQSIGQPYSAKASIDKRSSRLDSQSPVAHQAVSSSDHGEMGMETGLSALQHRKLTSTGSDFTRKAGQKASVPVSRAQSKETPSVPGVSSLHDTPETAYAVGPSDITMRAALQRWADIAGWTFLPEHWAVDIDIPLMGSATFSASFEEAVQSLVASTELGDYPLQPCFYSNKVVRVVRRATPCNRLSGSIRP